MRFFKRSNQRVVTGTVRDANDDVVALIGEWGSAPRAQVLAELRAGSREYSVQAPDGMLIAVEIKTGSTDQFIWVSWTPGHNNLDDLSREIRIS